MKVAWNLGLGDAIACAAIVAKFSLAHKDKKILVPSWKHNEVSVKSFFVNYPNIEIVILNAGEDGYWEIEADLRLGHYDHNFPKLDSEDFVQWFYRQAGMDISEKDKHCPIKEAAKKQKQNPLFKYTGKYTGLEMPMFPKGELWEYQFIHYDTERPFIDLKKTHPRLNAIMPNKESSILSYSELLTNSKEIHCIDSSFLHLVECLPTTGKLFYHKYARPDSPDYKYLKKDWTVIN